MQDALHASGAISSLCASRLKLDPDSVLLTASYVHANGGCINCCFWRTHGGFDCPPPPPEWMAALNVTSVLYKESVFVCLQEKNCTCESFVVDL